MTTRRRTRGVLGCVVAVMLLPASGSFLRPVAVRGQAARGQAQVPDIRPASRRDTSKLLTTLPQLPPRAVGAVLGRKLLPYRIGSEGPVGDGALQTDDVAASEPSAPSVLASFDGVNNVNGVLPPDPTGDIGPNHYIQMVNLSFAIWDRSGARLYGPADTNTLWQGFGGPCETTNDGDPIVQYDHLADRWVMSQFALPNYPKGPFYECIAISQTADPLGAWHRYEFMISESKLDDYPKLGVWPDGYYMSVNQFSCNMLSCSWAGQGVVVFQRDRMLQGGAASMVYFDLHGVDPNLGGMLPADLDGTTLPPAGTPNTFVQVDDDAWDYSPDQLQLWNFHVDWTNTANSTFTQVATLPTAAFDSNMCAYSRNCIPQPETTVKVDAIADRLMYRLQYRNFGTHQALVTNHTVDVDGTDRAGIRWYELRNAGGGWGIAQQGTYSPDAHHRWMGSVAMNGLGDMALGYSVSSSTVFPSIAATGRLNGDAPGAMTQGELAIVTGRGHQTHSAGRWGDYSQMAVDPVDDCTFWYTQEYYAVKGSAPWQTRIGAFKLRDCAPVNNPPAVSLVHPAEGAKVSGAAAIQINATDAEDAAGSLVVDWTIDGGTTWQPATYNATSLRYEASWDTMLVADGVYTVTARATDSGGSTATDSNAVAVDNLNEAPVASFTHSCSALTCSFDASGSTDDRGIASYTWDFGDLTTGSGQTVSHTYAAVGTYTVTLIVTDADGVRGDSESKSVVVATTMHIGDLDRSSTSKGNTWTAVVTIAVHDADHGALSAATVSGSWSNGGTGTLSCTTDSAGTCSFTKTGIAKRTSSVTFTVTNVSRASFTYNSAANHDPDGDSNGTTITAFKP